MSGRRAQVSLRNSQPPKESGAGTVVVAVAACTTSPSERSLTDQSGPTAAAVGTIRDEPQTFNRLVARDNVSVLMTHLT